MRDIGEQDLEIGEISLQGRNVSGFSILNDTCSNRTLTPASACTLDVIMSPEVYGDHLAYFQIPSNDPIRPLLRGLLRGIGQCFYGDANEDGRINIQDALIDLRIISQSIEPPAELCKADMDGNGRVDLGDVIKMLSILVNSKR